TVEWPSRRDAPTSAMPGPRSSAITSTPSSRPRRRISPPPACLTRLVAASVVTMAAPPQALSSSPARSQRAAMARRASPTWLSSTTGTRVVWPSTMATLLPPRDGHACALPGRGFDLELAHQPLGPAQPEAETGARGVAVLEGELEVGDPGALVL